MSWTLSANMSNSTSTVTQGQAMVDIKLRSEHLHTSYSELSNNLGALKGKHGLFLCELGECAHRKARTWMT